MKNKNLLVLVAAWTLLFGVTSATSSYIHEAKVDGINTISICDPSSNWTKCITMQDRNLWATEAYSCWEWVSKWSLSGYEYDNYDSLEECIVSEWEEFCNSTIYESFGECLWDFGDELSCFCLWRRKYWNLFSSSEDCYDSYDSYTLPFPTDPCMAENGTWVYWNFYQWWNNYGFPSTGSVVTWDTPVDCTNYWPLRLGYLSGRYSSNIFNNNWCTPINKNLRWWSGDSQENNRWFNETWNVAINAEDRQWPCNTWYHVPSIWEWNKVLEYWAEENELILGQEGWELADWWVWLYTCRNDYYPPCGILPFSFHYDFKIPFAGYRRYGADVGGFGNSSYLWSSSPSSFWYSYWFLSYISNGSYDLYTNWYLGTSDGFSIRCFKDSYLSFPTNENGDSGSGSASTHVTLTLTAWSNTCTLNDYNLGTHNASAEEQYIESSWQEILCEFLQNTWVRVLLSMGDLSDWSKLIWAENFTWVVTAIGNSLWSISNLTWWNYNLSWSQEIYRKAENTLWKWTWDLQIIWTIPAWTPSGTYTWSLEIVIQEG